MKFDSFFEQDAFNQNAVRIDYWNDSDEIFIKSNVTPKLPFKKISGRCLRMKYYLA